MSNDISKKNPFFDHLAQFAIKVAIVVFLVSLGIKWVTPGLRDALDSKWGKAAKELGKDDTRLVLTGFFVRNPAVHWKVSEIREKAYEYDKAVMEMELALGLLEMHRAESDVRKRYQDRLDQLRKLAAGKESK